MLQEYTIYKIPFEIPQEIIEDFENQLKKAGPIFNTKKNDNKRRQSNLKMTKSNIPFMTALNDFLDDVLDLCTRNASNWVLLESKPGCKAQLAHIDYENTPELHACKEVDLPLLVLVSLQPNTSIYVWENSPDVIKGIYKGEPITPTRVSLDAGDVFVFRADLVHAGGDYHSHNIRMHCYMDSPAVHRDPNRTFIISKHASEDVKKYICEVIS